VSAIVLSCDIVDAADVSVDIEEGVVVSVEVAGVSSAFFPQLTAASAMVSDKIATIPSAKFFRIVLNSPPLGPAAP
jgi:hypothetical protein